MLLAIDSNLVSQEIDLSAVLLGVPLMDMVYAAVTCRAESLYVLALYNPPSFPTGELAERLNKISDLCILWKGPIAIVGDFNVPGYRAEQGLEQDWRCCGSLRLFRSICADATK